MEDYDMNALYLYKSYYGSYYIGNIRKINVKSINIDGTNIKKEDFSKMAHKLTEEEIELYNKENIKAISGISRDANKAIEKLRNLKNALSCSEFVSINTEKLQEEINVLTDVLIAYTSQVMQFGDNKFKLSEYGRFLENKE